MTYDRQKAIEDIRQACSVDDAAIHCRSVVLKDVLKSVPMEGGSVDRTEGGIVFISAAAKSHDAESIRFQWQINQSLADQSDETLRVISELLKAWREVNAVVSGYFGYVIVSQPWGKLPLRYGRVEPKVCAAHCYDDQAAEEISFMLVESIAFIAAIFVIAGAVLGGLALVCWHAHPSDKGKLRKKPLLSNWK